MVIIIGADRTLYAAIDQNKVFDNNRGHFIDALRNYRVILASKRDHLVLAGCLLNH